MDNETRVCDTWKNARVCVYIYISVCQKLLLLLLLSSNGENLIFERSGLFDVRRASFARNSDEVLASCLGRFKKGNSSSSWKRFL